MFFRFCRSPLHAAAFNDQTECIQYLLNNDIEIDAADTNGRTALMVAAEKGHTKTVGKNQSFRYFFNLRFSGDTLRLS